MIKHSFDDFVLVMGLARSGTSWLGKILDSDPNVLFRYEPEYEPELDYFAKVDSILKKDGYTDEAAIELQRGYIKAALLKNKRIKAHDINVQKNFLDINFSPFIKYLPSLLSEKAMSFLFKNRKIRYVVKNVEFDWGLDWIAKSLGYPKIIFIIRHPCGNTFSYKSGKAHGMGELDSKDWATIWRVSHEKIGLPGHVNIPNFKVVVYEDLCKDPVNGTQDIFNFLGWKMTDMTQQFLRSSTSKASQGYWSVYKDPLEIANKWKSVMHEDEKNKVLEVVGDSKLMDFWK